MANAAEPPASAREQLLDAAERHFATRGYAAVTLKDIAQDLGIRQPSIYYHVPGGKEDLYVEVMIRHLERHRAGVEAAIAAAGPSLEKRMFAVAHWMLQRPPADVVRMSHSDLPGFPAEYIKLLEDAFERCVFHPIEAMFQEQGAQEQLRLKDARVLTRIFCSHMVMLALSRQHWSRRATEAQVIATNLDILLHGMLRREEV